MTLATVSRKPLGVRATPEQHRLLTEAAARVNRSVSSFVLHAALDAAQETTRKRTHAEVMAAIDRAQRSMKKHLRPGESLVAEAIAQSRADAARE